MSDRRSFLKSILAWPLIAGLAISGNKVKAHSKEIFINTFSIAGFQFYSGPQLFTELKPGEKLALECDPQNVYDEFAVKIVRGKDQLGFIPCSDNKHIFRLLEQGCTLVCRIVRLKPHEADWQKVGVRVWLKV